MKKSIYLLALAAAFKLTGCRSEAAVSMEAPVSSVTVVVESTEVAETASAELSEPAETAESVMSEEERAVYISKAAIVNNLGQDDYLDFGSELGMTMQLSWLACRENTAACPLIQTNYSNEQYDLDEEGRRVKGTYVPDNDRYTEAKSYTYDDHGFLSEYIESEGTVIILMTI